MAAKKYEIDSFDKLLNLVNEKNISILAVDLAQWLIMYSAMIEKYRKEYPTETKGKKNTEIAKCTFVWIDDKKNDIKSFELKNTDTGEIKTFKIKKTK